MSYKTTHLNFFALSRRRLLVNIQKWHRAQKRKFSIWKLARNIIFIACSIWTLVAACWLGSVFSLEKPTAQTKAAQETIAQHKLQLDISEYGAIGDFLGGTLNPLFGVITVALLYFTYNTQRESTKRGEMHNAKAAFEQSLYARLGNYSALVSSVVIDSADTIRIPISNQTPDYMANAFPNIFKRLSPSGFPITAGSKNTSAEQNLAKRETTHTGRGGLQKLYDSIFRGDRLEKMMSHLAAAYGGTGSTTYPSRIVSQVLEEAEKSNIDGALTFLKQLLITYEAVYKTQRTNFDASYRILYRLFVWIDQSEFSMSDRWHYAMLVRAQISHVELLFLLLNCISKHGPNMCAVANKYALFDNLDTTHDVVARFISEIRKFELDPSFQKRYPNGWPLTASAFNSEDAKDQLAEKIKSLNIRQSDFK